MNKNLPLPKSNFEGFILDLAKTNNVHYKKTNSDVLAETFTRLSDDEIELDKIESLIIALARANVIAKKHILKLHSGYLRESSNV